MQTKLTLRLEARLIEQAKRYARARGTSVSQVVADYFALLTEAPGPETEPAPPPLVRSLRGALADRAVCEEDYYRYLEEKHR